jgi:hypothetical protein
MSHRLRRIAFVPVVAFLFMLALALALSAGSPLAAHAQGGTGIVRVAKSGSDIAGCGSAAEPCATLQYAIYEAAEGDEIRVAQGTYTGTQDLIAESVYGPYTYTQVALVTKTLTLRGGYSTADWSTSVPTQNVTTIDAQGYGRGVSVVGTGGQSVTVEGFTITGGDYTGLGNPPGEAWLACAGTGIDCGGGLIARDSVIVLRSMVISGNNAGGVGRSAWGGGVYLYDVHTGSRIEDTLFYSNTALGDNAGGGGADVEAQGDVTIVRAEFVDNYAEDEGGGMTVSADYGLVVIEDCSFSGNSVFGPNGNGGGLAILPGDVRVRNSEFTGNSGEMGGGLYASFGGAPDALIIDGNTIISNTGRNCGGGVRVRYGRPTLFTNNLIAGNGGGAGGAACLSHQAETVWMHNTIAQNTGGGVHEGLLVFDTDTAVTLVNNIIVSHTVGIDVNPGVSVDADHTLFFGNGDNFEIEAGATVTTTNEITGSAPMFVDPDAWDYHLQAGSPAIDAGADTDVRRDIDGDWRPDNCAYDIGADEFVSGAKCWKAYLPLLLRG